MKYLSALLALLLVQVSLSAHEGDLLAINNVKISQSCEYIIYDFEIENTFQLLLKDVKIELQANDIELDSRTYESYPINLKKKETLLIPVDKLGQINPRTIEIKVTEIFGIEKEWGGWHGIDLSVANFNDIGDYEIYADAPYRATIYDENNNLNPIPLHIMAHDGNDIWLSDHKLHIEFIDVYLKKSTDSNFGAPLDLSSLSPSELDAIITSKSPDSTQIGIQSFDLSLPTYNANHTFAFNELTNPNTGFKYTNVNNEFWYFTLMLQPEMMSFLSDNDHLDIKVVSTLRNLSGEITKKNSFLRVFRNAQGIPKISKYYRGDTHVHTIYTHSILEFGQALSATKEAAKSVGIDWIIATDHTTDFDNWKGHAIQAAWERLGTDVDVLNAADPSIPFIRGQEVSLLNRQQQLVHFLAYPGYESPTYLPYLGDGGGDIQFTNTAMQTVLNRLDTLNGFAYAAHPFAIMDEVPVVGGWWNVGDSEFPNNGTPFNYGGNVGCNNLSAPSDLFSRDDDKVVYDRLKGAQIWGDRYSMIGEIDPYDPYNIRGEVDAPQFEEAPMDDSHYLIRYRQGEQVVNFVNWKGLKMKNANPDIKNFKFYFSAGTDAHGSFNYSNTSGGGTVFDEDDTVVKNLAFGNISCVAYCPDGMGLQGENALKAMYNGNFSVSDGPLLVQSVSLSGDNNQNEVLMGEDTVTDVTAIGDVYFNLQLASTLEFGPTNYLKVFIGTEDGETAFNITDVSDFNDVINLSLEEAFTNAGIEMPLDKYFYIRAELQTTADYSNDAPRILTSENFYSFTNPIWLKVNSPVISAVNENVVDEFKVYPNPSSGLLYINASEKVKFVKIFNAEGKVVLNQKMKKQQLDISHLPAGNYTLEAQFEKGSVVEKIVVL